MTTQAVSILCGKCRVGLEGPAEPDPESVYTCPVCGQSDSFENVMASVTAFSEELMAEKFDKMLVDSFRSSKMIKVTGKPNHKGFHPFITDMKL
jgi:hypothetical protein